MFESLMDFNPNYALIRHFAPKRMRSYLVNFKDEEEWSDLTEQEKSKYSMDYLEEEFQRMAEKYPEILSERLMTQEETIRRINASISEKVKEDTNITRL